jgi:hypothetical protein
VLERSKSVRKTLVRWSAPAVGALLVALSVGLVAPAAAMAANGGNSDAAHACQQGGWQGLEASDGTDFTNTGDCVSYAAQGGTLVPSAPNLSLSFTPTFDPNYCNVFVTLDDFAPSTTYTVDFTVAGFPGYHVYRDVTTDSGGDVTTDVFSFYNQNRQMNAAIGSVNSGFINITC